MTTDTPALQVRRPLMTLGIILIIGLGIGAILVLTGVAAPGVLSLDQAFLGLGFGFLVVAAVLGALIMTLANLMAQVAAMRAEQDVIKSVLSDGEERQHVILIEGIGEKYASRLNTAGIISIPQLIKMDTVDLAHTADVTPQLAAEWQAMGRFMQLRGVGPQYAEVIVRAGVGTVAELARANAEALSATIKQLQSARKVALQGSEIGPNRVRRWIEAARDYLESNRVNVRQTAPTA